jgi:hypothetical protein
MAPKFDGVTVKVGGVEYIIPPLNLKQIKKFQPELESIAKKTVVELLDFTSQILYSTLSRNYPEITQDQCDEMVDVKNVGTWMQAITAQSGLQIAGGVLAGSDQTGTQSTPT